MLDRTLKFCAAISIVLGFLLVGAPAQATANPVPLGTAGNFAVLGGSAVTNTGPTVVTGDLGVSSGSSVTGFPPGLVNGTIHAADAVALQAQNDLTTAYNNAAGQAADAALPPDIGGLTLVPGVYNGSSTVGLTGTLTLDAGGDPNAVWVFQVGSGLTTASASNVQLINQASPCNVFWQVGSSATLGTNSTMVGTIMALTSATATTGTNVDGRLLARNGAVTLDTNNVGLSDCAAAPVNSAPVADDSSVSTDFETPVDFTATADDADGDDLTYTFGPVGGIGGTLVCEDAGSPDCTYTPPGGQSGTATVTFTVTDGTESDTGTVTFDVGEESTGPTPGPTDSPGADDGTSDAGGDTADSSDQRLPDTGGMHSEIGLLGVGLLVAGLLTVAGSRRRRGLHRA